MHLANILQLTMICFFNTTNRHPWMPLGTESWRGFHVDLMLLGVFKTWVTLGFLCLLVFRVKLV